MRKPFRKTRREVLLRFGHAVRERRLALGMSQEELADACNLDRSYVGGVERGERNVSLLNIASLSEGLQLSISELLRQSEMDGGE